jgi:hypothetical protein
MLEAEKACLARAKAGSSDEVFNLPSANESF